MAEEEKEEKVIEKEKVEEEDSHNIPACSEGQLLQHKRWKGRRKWDRLKDKLRHFSSLLSS